LLEISAALPIAGLLFTLTLSARGGLALSPRGRGDKRRRLSHQGRGDEKKKALPSRVKG